MKIGVVTITYNSSKVVVDFLKSLSKQTYPDFKLYIIDNNSQDDTIDLIKKHGTNFKGVGQPLRIILTGSKFGPGIYDIIISLGKEEVQKRLGDKIIK